MEFKTTQSLVDFCTSYYGDMFENCLRQVKSLYPHLDLSKVTIDNPLPSTLVRDIIFEGTDDSTESKEVPKDDSVVLAQPAANPLVNPLNAKDLPAQDVQNLPPKGNENPHDTLAS